MKLLFISDIHGSEYYASEIGRIYSEEKPDYIILLGDILYHGARNPLTKGYAPKAVAAVLNEYKDNIICVRGNCDSEVDQMVLKFEIMADYSNLLVDDLRMFVTHGHKYNRDKMPNLPRGSVFIQGHTHIPVAEEADGICFVNPGSLALPKEGNPNSYGVYSDGEFAIKDLSGSVIKSIRVKKGKKARF